MGSLMTYSAIAAKISAMRSRLLTQEDFSRLAFLDNLPEAAETLKNHPSYGQVFLNADAANMHRAKIEQLLWLSLYQDYSSLYRFASMKQRKFLDLYFMHFEIDIMKKCLRDAASNRRSELDLSIFEDFFHCHSKLDLIGLAECVSIGEFVGRLRGSDYYEPLKNLYDQGISSLFDYESALDILYFILFWKNLEKALSSRDLNAVKECMGEKIDLLNLEWLFRAKQHYHLSENAILGFLIPVCYRLKKTQIQEMAAAVSPDHFLRILKTTRYGNRILGEQTALSNQENQTFKLLFRSLLDAVYQASGRRNPYSAAIINSYFYFKEEEIRKLITVIEGIRYKLGGKEILSCLAES